MDAQELKKALQRIADMGPDTSEMSTAHEMAQIAADALAERAVSPAESVQSTRYDKAFIALMVKYIDARQDKSHGTDVTREFDNIAYYIDASRAAAHAEGRRNAREELEAKIAAAARDKDGNHVDDLRGWLDEAREENEVQGTAFHACSLRLKQAEEELAKEKGRADKAEANSDALRHCLEKAERRWLTAEAESLSHGPAAKQAPDLSQLDVCYERTINGTKLQAVWLSDVQTLLSSTAQHLQQEGGKDAPVAYRVTFNEFRHFSGAVTAGRDYVQFDEPKLDDRFFEGCDSLVITPLYAAPQPSDNLQQASTAQAEPCGGCGNADPDKRCIGCGHPFAAKEAATATDSDWRYQARRYCKGDGGWTDWQDVTAEQHEKYKADPSFEVRAWPNSTAQATPEGAELPPLPKAFSRFNINGADGYRIKGYTADQMRDYARAALAATTAAEPVYQVKSSFSDTWVDMEKEQAEFYEKADMGYTVRVLYRAAPPQQVDTKGDAI